MATVGQVLEQLDYEGSEGLVRGDPSNLTLARAYHWRPAQERLGIDAAYFLGDQPVLYFKEVPHGRSSLDEQLRELHQRLWNHRAAPLLVAILPDEVRVYNCMYPPRESELPDEAILLEARDVVARASNQQQLAELARSEVDSGRLLERWRPRIIAGQPVDRRLLGNLRELRHRLIRAGLSGPIANALIGRAIYVSYLEAREELGDWLHGSMHAGRYADLLKTGTSETYAFLATLSERVNGTVFPVSDAEQRLVTDSHLRLVAAFLSGENLTTGQLQFWPYDFRYIPIQVISAIYEEFIGADQRATGAFYTPPELVDTLLDAVIADTTEPFEIRVLDPACGSGIFLVEVFRRLVELQRRREGLPGISFDRLRALMVTAIAGCDVNRDALYVAAFSCSLALLDSADPATVSPNIRLPHLVDRTLLNIDFLADDPRIATNSFDLVIGNPPWSSNTPADVVARYTRSGRPIGDRQLAQAFYWRATEVVTQTGRVALLGPAKGILTNKSNPNVAFRREFLEQVRVERIINYAAFRHLLFSRATSPPAAVIWRRRGPSELRASDETVLYQVPKPSGAWMGHGRIVPTLDESCDVAVLDAIWSAFVWKAAMWAGPRDLALLERLRTDFDSLLRICAENDILHGEGFQRHGGDNQEILDADQLMLVPYRVINGRRLHQTDLVPLVDRIVHRARDPRLYRGSRLLVRRSVLTGGRLATAYIDHPTAYTHEVIGFRTEHRTRHRVQALGAILGSSLARYYLFLTSASWGVERDEVQKIDLMRLPMPVNDLDSETARLLSQLFTQVLAGSIRAEAEIDRILYREYGLSASEIALVEEVTMRRIPEFYGAPQSGPVTDALLREYVQTAEREMEPWFQDSDYRLNVRWSHGSSPFVAARLDPVADTLDLPSGSDTELLAAVEELEATVGRFSPTAVRRIMRQFDMRGMLVAKPNANRYWTAASALQDVDELVAHLLAVGDEWQLTAPHA